MTGSTGEPEGSLSITLGWLDVFLEFPREYVQRTSRDEPACRDAFVVNEESTVAAEAEAFASMPL